MTSSTKHEAPRGPLPHPPGLRAPLGPSPGGKAGEKARHWDAVSVCAGGDPGHLFSEPRFSELAHSSRGAGGES